MSPRRNAKRGDRVAWSGLSVMLVVCFATSPSEAQQARTPSSGERYALLVAVRTYDAASGLKSLQYPERDMERLRSVLLDSGYRSENVVLMSQSLGARETRFLPLGANIRRELAALTRDREPEDSILVAFAGHGAQFRDSDESYICPADARLNNPKTLVSLKDVYAELDRSKAGLRLLFSDACRNDPFTSSARRATVDLDSVTRPQKVRLPGGTAALFSCSDGEVAYEIDDLRHGVFFHFVIEGLQGKADLDADRDVSVEELSHYAKRRVSDYVRANFSGERQMPQLLNNVRGAANVVRLDGGLAAFRRGREQFLSGRFEPAIAEYDESIRLNPDRPDPRAHRALATWLQARTLYWSGELGSESGLFPKQGEPLDKDCLRRRADLRRRILDDIDSARRLDPRSELAEALRVEMLWNQGAGAAVDETRAMREFTDVLLGTRFATSDPDATAVRLYILDVAPLLFMGDAHDLAAIREKVQPRRTAFLRAVQRAIRKDLGIEAKLEDVTPEEFDPALERALGRKLTIDEDTRSRSTGKRTAAGLVIGLVEDEARSSEDDPTSSFLLSLAKAYVCADLGFLDETIDNERAVREATTALERAPDCMLAYLIRAHARTKLKQHERAVDDLTRAIRLRPEGYYLYEMRAAAYRNLPDAAAAQADDQKSESLRTKFSE